MRENVVLRDPEGEIRAWGSVHDRAEGRMLFVHVVERDLPDDVADACSPLLFAWADEQARAVGAARGLDVQQIDTGAFADDDRQHAWLEAAGFEQGPHLVPDEPPGRPPTRPAWSPTRPAGSADGVTIRLVRRTAEGLPDAVDLHAVHQVLEAGLPRPLQLVGGDLRRVRAPAARGPRPPLGPLVARRAREPPASTASARSRSAP